MEYKVKRTYSYNASEQTEHEDIEHRAHLYTYKKKVNGKWRYYYGEPIEKEGLDTTGITKNKDGTYNSYGGKFKTYVDAVNNAAKIQKAEEVRKKNQEPIRYHVEKLIKNLKASADAIARQAGDGRDFISSLFSRKKKKRKVTISSSSTFSKFR